MARYGLLIDTKSCINCQTCNAACKANHGLTPVENFITYQKDEVGAYPNVRFVTSPRQCAHCDNPPCLAVCPTGATYRNEDGLVLVDADRCIGCRYCQQACPYDVRIVREDTGVVDKCSLCADRIAQGLEPLCVKSCPTSARTFGDLDDPDSDLVKQIALKHAEPIGGELTGARVYYAR